VILGPKPVELQRIYVDPTQIGGGVGATLMESSLEKARSLGYQTIWLGVWEHNHRALKYASQPHMES
jgi:GNAT superfamily N-acetyltransferase